MQDDRESDYSLQGSEFYQEHPNSFKVYNNFDPKQWEQYVGSLVVADKITRFPEVTRLLPQVFSFVDDNGINRDSVGTGFVVDNQGMWVTAYHVYDSYMRRLKNGESTEILRNNIYESLPETTLVFADKQSDVVVCRSPKIVKWNCQGIQLSSQPALSEEGPYYVLGFPVNTGGKLLPRSRTPYLAVGRYNEGSQKEKSQQLKAAGWLGFSGSPVLNYSMEVCGVMIRAQLGDESDSEVTVVPLKVFGDAIK